LEAFITKLIDEKRSLKNVKLDLTHKKLPLILNMKSM